MITEKDAGTYRFTGIQQRALVAGITVDGQNMMSDPNYSIVFNARESFLVIEPLPLTITTPSDEKVYDGDALTKSEGATLDHSYWTANIGGTWTKAETAAPGSVTLGTGETITFNVTGSQTPVGSDDNTYSIDWGENKSSNYKINATLGTLTVTEAELKVTVKDIEKVYNGEEQEGRPFVATITGTGEKIETADYTVEGLGKGDVLTVTYTQAKGTNVTEYTGSFAETYTIVNADGEDVTGNYSKKTFAAGKLTITPAEITIKADNKTKVYDNDATTDPDLTATVTGVPANGVAPIYSLSRAEGQNADEYAITVTAKAETNPNYTVKVEGGTFTITAREVTVKVEDRTTEYNGSEQYGNSEYTFNNVR